MRREVTRKEKMAALNRVIRAAHSPLTIRRLSDLVSDPAAIRIASNPNPNPDPNLIPCTRMAPPVNREKLGTRSVQWVFLGCPGVGKGTYASRLSNLLGVPHISTGDLVRDELASSGSLTKKVPFFSFLSRVQVPHTFDGVFVVPLLFKIQ